MRSTPTSISGCSIPAAASRVPLTATTAPGRSATSRSPAGKLTQRNSIFTHTINPRHTSASPGTTTARARSNNVHSVDHQMVRFLVTTTRLAVDAAAILTASPKASAGWELVESMPTGRAYHAGATIDGFWYVAGGEKLVGNGIEYPTEVDVFDPVQGHWTKVGDLAEGRKYFPAVADSVTSRAFFLGGFVLGGSS